MYSLILKEGVSDLNSTIVTVGTVTYAIKLRKLLSREGIRSKLVKVDAREGSGGCTNGVEIENKDFYRVISILKNNGISYSVYNG